MSKDAILQPIKTRQQKKELIEGLIRDQGKKHESLFILEAGCGRSWPFDLGDVSYHLTGVDTDKHALELRKNKACDLDEAVEADLCSVDMEADKYDVIYCCFVLEHIAEADLVIKNFVRWTKPGGIIILLIPDPDSVQGFVTRVTPHWFHVAYYRYVLRYEKAGKLGYGPYPTYFHPIVSRKGMRSLCDDDRNGVALVGEYAEEWGNTGTGATKVILEAVKKLINIVSLGSLSDKHTNLIYVIEKNAQD